MSCYFRHMKDVFDQAGIRVTNDNKKAIDRIINKFVDVEYKDCSPIWKAVKEKIRGDDKQRSRLASQLRKELKSL
ncbi:MAG: hypothetical protein JXD19_08385 [Deltaproteobacteria bacterium]|nr:hypothetical protein [Deltaproteobacteria bacterium]